MLLVTASLCKRALIPGLVFPSARVIRTTGPGISVRLCIPFTGTVAMTGPFVCWRPPGRKRQAPSVKLQAPSIKLLTAGII